MDDRNIPNDGILNIVLPQPNLAAPATTQLRKATEFLEDSSRIGNHRAHYAKYCRYVTLYAAGIFNSLVTLYASLLINQWPSFKRLSDAFPSPQGITAQVYTARVYISHWFLNLYTSNRDAIRKLSPVAFAQYFQHELAPFSTEYDRYLTLLNAAIRPTHVKGISEDVLYIPLISQTFDWAGTNPFAINNFVINYDYFMGIIDIMKERKNWNMSPLVTDTVGRPSWLFDWHDEACCSWFPAERNYSADDVTIAYIIGEACSPRLAPRDVDDWISLPKNVQPANVTVNLIPRMTARRFHGSYEVRTFEIRPFEFPEITFNDATSQSKKRKTPSGALIIGGPDPAGADSSTATAEPTLALTNADNSKVVMKQGFQYQIIDWLYYCRVILEIDPHTRSGTLKTLVMG